MTYQGLSSSYGQYPATSKAQNEFGDKECHHVNLTGVAIRTSDPFLSQLRTYTGGSGNDAWMLPNCYNPYPPYYVRKEGLIMVLPLMTPGSTAFTWRQKGSYGAPEKGVVSWSQFGRGWYKIEFSYTWNMQTFSGFGMSASVHEYIDLIYDESSFDQVQVGRSWYTKGPFEFHERIHCVSNAEYYANNFRTKTYERVEPPFNAPASSRYPRLYFCQGVPATALKPVLELLLPTWSERLAQIARSEVSNVLTDQDRGDVAARCVQDLRVLTDNEVANVMELIDLAMFDPDDLFKVAGEGLPDLASAAYLTKKYGLDNDARDLNNFLKHRSSKLDHYVKGARIARASGHFSAPSKRCVGEWSTDYRLKLYYTPPQDVLTFFAYEAWVYGFSVTAEPIWDFVPFSFVVDWALNLGDCFNRLDGKLFLSTCRQRSVVETTRSTNLVDAASLHDSLSGTLTVTVFDRQVLSSLPDMPVRLEVTTPSLDHFWEGAALLVQQRHR
jgi:hypothetical protein